MQSQQQQVKEKNIKGTKFRRIESADGFLIIMLALLTIFMYCNASTTLFLIAGGSLVVHFFCVCKRAYHEQENEPVEKESDD